MRRALVVASILVAALATQQTAQAAPVSSGTFRMWVPVGAYPCTGGCTASAGVCGSFRQVVSAPDFDSSCTGQSAWVQGVTDCVGGVAQVAITAAPTDPGYNRGSVVAIFSWVGAFAITTAQFVSSSGEGTGTYQGVAAVAVTPANPFAVGTFVDACDGASVPVGATVQFVGAWLAA